MGEKGILILCYSGEMPNSMPCDKTPEKGFIFQEGKGFYELKKMLIDELGVQEEDEKLEITYPCPTSTPSYLQFKPLHLQNGFNVTPSSLQFKPLHLQNGFNVTPSSLQFKPLHLQNGFNVTPCSPRFKPLLLQNDNDVKFMTTIATLSLVPRVDLYIRRSKTMEFVSKKKKTMESIISTPNFEIRWDVNVPRGIYGLEHWNNPYKEFPEWMNMLVHTNKGTQVQWDLISKDAFSYCHFKRVFWSFGAAIEGFKHFRPVIHVDGIALSGKYRGHLLFATSVDSDGRIYPLAYAVVEEENSDSWTWFLHILRLRVTQREGICLISNMHEGISSVVNDSTSGWKEPNAHHRLCLEHLANKFEEKYKDKDLKDLMYYAGCQHQKRKYEQCMNELKQLNPECLNFFTHIREEKWTQSYDNGYRYGYMTTDKLKCLTGVLMGVRELPIMALVKSTFNGSMFTFGERRVAIDAALRRGELYTKYAMDKINKWKERASSHTVVKLDEHFEVVTGSHGSNPPKGLNKQMVSLKDKTCTCNKWQSFGIPCSHVISVCLHFNLDYWKFVDEYYKLSVYALCYSPLFHFPGNITGIGPKLDFVIVHPDQQFMGDHAHLNNSKSGTKIRCGLCKQQGHHRRYCPLLSKDTAEA